MKLDDITIKVWRAIIDFNRNSENEEGVTNEDGSYVTITML